MRTTKKLFAKCFRTFYICNFSAEPSSKRDFIIDQIFRQSKQQNKVVLIWLLIEGFGQFDNMLEKVAQIFQKVAQKVAGFS